MDPELQTIKKESYMSQDLKKELREDELEYRIKELLKPRNIHKVYNRWDDFDEFLSFLVSLNDELVLVKMLKEQARLLAEEE